MSDQDNDVVATISIKIHKGGTVTLAATDNLTFDMIAVLMDDLLKEIEESLEQREQSVVH